MSRYARNWAWWMGMHWTHRRAPGEPQLTFNYTQALSDYKNNFSFSRGVTFSAAKQYQHIIPALVNRIWERDNDKATVLAEVAQNGGVTGDAFAKIAYDPAWVDSARNVHPGRVRILPLNPSTCFPEWHPHDRERLVRFKLKYRFWGTNLEGTRQVFTYTEVLTDDTVEEYVNDELIDRRPNRLGQIPVVHIPNISVSGSPWGISDIENLIALNREYNEKATEISDIVNYHSQPITVMQGAKNPSTEVGAHKVWHVPQEAKVYTLENGVDLVGPLQYMELIKRAMHEMSGVPETALGQQQAISNTSGVALAIQYLPLMSQHEAKVRNYSVGLRKINELALRTLFLFEPETLLYDPDTDGIIEPGQPSVIDPTDPLVYRTECHWPPPLPVDTLIKLNEIQLKMGLGLESKRGALKDLGTEFPDEKAAEIFEELRNDAIEQGALEFIRAQINSAILAMTGMTPQGENAPAPPTGANSDSASAPPTNPVANQATVMAGTEHKIMTELVTLAHGSRTPQRRDPDTDSA
ncbi:phage portal protein [Herbidospora galbida]|uniref:Phage portal protein n=1 Tax=Herbidospora galbida TaxID=2575442 RepID=A0A4U3M9G9_9ACTN|nr:phage portal protein [Herbidospora galbida]